MSRSVEFITEQDVRNIEAVERGEMDARECIADSERRMRGRQMRRRRRNHAYYLDVYYIDGVTHYGYIPAKKLSGYREFMDFHRNAGMTSRRYVADGRMYFERKLGFHPYRVSNKKYEAKYLTPLAKKLYDYPNKRLNMKLYREGKI